MPALEWRETARADLLAIVDYISDDNPDAAQRLKDEIEDRVSTLPDSGFCGSASLTLVESHALPGYDWDMTELLDRAVQAARTLPASSQDDIARIVMRLMDSADGDPPVALSVGERDTVTASKAAAARGEFATEEQVRAVWAKHGL